MSEWRPTLSEADERLLLELLAIDTTTPMEADGADGLRAAQELLRQAAERWGFDVAHFAAPQPACLEDVHVPVSVSERAAAYGPTFLVDQPNLVLRLGRSEAEEATIVFNLHLDTVSGYFAPFRQGRRVYGRGAVDSKGVAVAVLAGVRRVVGELSGLTDTVSILLEFVGGEEGGAMGVYGTRALVKQGFIGRLNVVAEPTRLRYFDETTTSMTVEIVVGGSGATDDQPERGENATILLAALVDRLTRTLASRVEAVGGRMCVAGLHTGTTHNRVFGGGRLYLNFAYRSLVAAKAIEQATAEELDSALRSFAADYSDIPIARLAAASAERICHWRWLKRRLPVLSNRDRQMEAMLLDAGVERHEAGSGLQPFTCDAMWFAGRGRYTIVLGPGDAAGNKAHADGEFIDIDNLDCYAGMVASVISGFHAWVASKA